jgi:hypothetical protein
MRENNIMRMTVRIGAATVCVALATPAVIAML